MFKSCIVVLFEIEFSIDFVWETHLIDWSCDIDSLPVTTSSGLWAITNVDYGPYLVLQLKFIY